MRLDELPTPALLLDLDVLERNLERMAARAARLGVALRPHVKTHKCVEIAARQRRLGIAGITVSTLYEARVFAEHGFDDITWAFPVILNRIGEARALAERVRLRLVVDSPVAVEALEEDGHPFHVWMKVDCGYHRAGVDPASPEALGLARALSRSSTLAFDGILTHSGQAYRCRDRRELAQVARDERRVMVELADRLRSRGIQVEGVSVGSTPAMSVAEDLSGVSEARPGNYAFYDLTQCVLGACGPGDCALTVLASVVSCQPGARHSVIDAGALALSTDPGPAHGPRPSMGRLYADYGRGELRPDARLIALSQEHGVVNAPFPVGTRLRVLPNHSCLAAACFDAYEVVRGEVVVDRWRIWRGRDGAPTGPGQEARALEDAAP